MDRIGTANWTRFKNLMNQDVVDTFQQEPIIWLRSSGGIDEWGEDNPNELIQSIPLKGQFLFNYFRTWPLDDNSNAGKLDGENQVIIFNRKYLYDLGYLLPDGRMNYNPASDYFMHQGITYSCQGDTPVSQAKDEDLFFMIILKREENFTGEIRSTPELPPPPTP